jgi:dihydroxy-acid dehydratase
MQAEKPVLNKYSRIITEPKSQGASQAMLYATGLTPDTIKLPQVGICSVWFEGNPCNMHLNDLAADVKIGVGHAGLTGFRFNTIGVSDGISMGTDGMSYSLQSRDVIADSIETIMGGQWYDALVAIPGCDKNMPGCLIAMGRLNRPAIMVYGGTIRAGCTETFPQLDIVSAFQSFGESMYGKITEDERQEIVENSCPGPGACGGMYTANTMATAIEAMGKIVSIIDFSISPINIRPPTTSIVITYIHMNIYIYICMYVYIQMNPYICLYICMCTHRYILWQQLLRLWVRNLFDSQFS